MSRTPRKPRPKPAGLPPVTEADVVRGVLDAARLLGLALDRQNTGAASYERRDGSSRHVRYGTAGDADFRGTLPGGRRLEVEVKRPGKRPTPAQLAKLDALNRAGGVGIWTDDSAAFLRLMPVVIAGGRCELDDHGTPWITDEPAKESQGT